MVEKLFSDVTTRDLVVVVDGREYAIAPGDVEYVLETVTAGEAVVFE